MGLESKIHNALMRTPAIKKSVKRIYQGTSVAISRPKKSEGNIVRVTPNDECEYLFGYYDKSPWDASGRYMLCLRVKDASKSVAPGDEAEIVLIDAEKNNTIKTLTKTHTWNVQQGCMAGWLGPDYKDEIFYNDLRDGEYRGVVLNIKTGKERLLDMPVYSVSNDGRVALSLDFSRLHRLRPGYGYSNLKDTTAGEKVPEGPCVWRIEINTGKAKPILAYRELYEFEHRADMEDAEHKVNHLMLSPDGKRFMIIHRWLKGGKKISRLLTCDIDGKNLYNLSDDNMVSHCYWKNNKEILAYCRKNGVNGYFLMKDKTQDYEQKWNFLTADGHPSYSPDGNMVVTDTYPNRKRICTIRVLSDTTSTIIAKVYAPFKYDNDTRCDLHPRWSRDGKQVCFDGCFEGRRGVYVIKDIELQLPHTVIQPGTTPQKTVKGLVSCVIPSYKRSNTLKRAIDSALNQTYDKLEVLVVDDNEVGDEWDLKLKKIINGYKNSRVRLIMQPKHINGAVARNYGIKEASGEYIAFLDDDDEWSRDKIEEQLKLQKSKDVDVVTCLWATYKDNKEMRKCPVYDTENIQFKILSRAVSIYTSTVLIKKDLLYKFGGFDEKLNRHQDLQLLADAAEYSEFALLDKYKVKLHTDSGINRPNTAKLIVIKKDFLEYELNTIRKYSRTDKKRIYGAHNYELLFSSIKEKKPYHTIQYLAKSITNIPATRDVAKRIKSRNKQ